MNEMGPAAAALVPRMGDGGGDIIANSLSFVRSHLGMEIAYLSEFVGDDLVFRAVDAPGFEEMIDVGDTLPLSEVYCQHILAGRLPELMPDTDHVPFAQGIAMTQNLPVRSHVSIPIRRTNGEVYGMFCCLSRKPRPSLNSRDLEVMRAFASLSADQVNNRLTSELALQVDLELFVIESALGILAELPEPCYLAVNTSPATLASGRISPLVEAVGGKRVLVEITEHAAIEDLDVLLMEISFGCAPT